MNFGFDHRVNPVTISPSGSNTAGETYSLMCSAILFDPIPLPSNVPSPTLEWYYGPNGNASLPSGVTPMATAVNNNSNSITYTSTLLVSPLSQSHTGMYTCRIGAGILANSATIIVNGTLKIYYQTYNVVIFWCPNFSPFQHLPSLSRSLLVELQCWDKMATLSHVVLMGLETSMPL